MNAWEAYNGPMSPEGKKHQPQPKEKYAFLKNIEDPAVRSFCHLGLIERDRVRAELNMLKSRVEVIVDMRPLGSPIEMEASNVTVIDAVDQLTDSERNALLAAIDPKSLSLRHWRLGETGEVLDQHDRFVFMPGFATGITKVLGKFNLASPRMRRK
jgi:hypothetical protein